MIEESQQQNTEEQQQEPSQLEVATMIADTLGEAEAGPRNNIAVIVRALGRTQAKELLSLTLQTEEHGGLMLPDGSRRRTPGGVFFYLAYTTGKPKPGKVLHRPQQRKPQNNAKQAKDNDAKPSSPKETSTSKASQNGAVEASKDIAFSWEDRVDIVNEASTQKGNTSTVKITVIGRPGKIVDKGQFIVTVMESNKVPTLPKGLPTPNNVATKYAVYIQKKQWSKVEEAIKDEEDALIIEGFPKTDAEVSAIAVFCTNVTTKKLQAALRQSKAEVK